MTGLPPHGRELGIQTSVAENENRSATDEIFDSESASPESTIIDEVSADSREGSTSGTASQRKKQSRLSSLGSVVVARQSSVVKRKAESSGPNVTSTTVVKSPPKPKPNPLKMRLKVRIGDQLILVPVLERFFAFCMF